MDLVRSVLDNRLVDREGRLMGRVDGVIIEAEPGRQPRVMYLETGLAVCARRLNWRPAQRFVKWLTRRGPKSPEDFRIPWTRVIDVGIDVKVDLDARDTPPLTWEKWLSEHIVRRVPGG